MSGFMSVPIADLGTSYIYSTAVNESVATLVNESVSISVHAPPPLCASPSRS